MSYRQDHCYCPTPSPSTTGSATPAPSSAPPQVTAHPPATSSPAVTHPAALPVTGSAVQLAAEAGVVLLVLGAAVMLTEWRRPPGP